MHTQSTNNTQNNTLRFKSLVVDYKKITLNLHRNFTTAHSTSATRVNFFVRVTSSSLQSNAKLYGYGQCGLPPKKPGCYMSDIPDCFNFMAQLTNRLAKQADITNKSQQIKIEGLPTSVQNKLNSLKSELKDQIIQVIYIMQQYNETQNYRAPKCALEFALIDLLTKYHNITATELLFPEFDIKKHEVYSFYTLSLEEHKYMIQNAILHKDVTKCIKIKYNNNVKQLLQLLKALNKQNIGQKIIVDANCSWSCDEFLLFTQGLKQQQFQNTKFSEKILYVEQPFNLQISQLEKWMEIKNKTDIKILADQSFVNEKNIDKIKKVAHAVNIKTEKTGGVFATLRAGLQAKKQNLQVMFGSMCSTQLGCTQTFQFHPLAQYMDIDGALLVKQPQLVGGFSWGHKGLVYPYQGQHKGLRIDASLFFQ